jgi:hypothetical protein
MIHGKILHNQIICIIAKTPGIADCDQKKIQRCRLVAAPIDMMVTNQTVIKPTELLG